MTKLKSPHFSIKWIVSLALASIFNNISKYDVEEDNPVVSFNSNSLGYTESMYGINGTARC
jgi:hypothetical protein